MVLYLRSLLKLVVKWITDSPLFGPLHRSLDELIIGRLFNEYPRSSTATLAHVEEKTKVGGFNCVRHVSIGENDVGRFPAELEGDTLQVGLCCHLADQLTDLERESIAIANS